MGTTASPILTDLRSAALLVARTAAWSLLFGGWLVIGALGRQQAAPGVGELAATALWLLTLGLAAGASVSWTPSRRALQCVLLLAGGATAAALIAFAGGARWTTWVIAPSWALLLVAASRVVRAWRLQPGPRPASPLWPASLGALAAWALAGDPAAAVAAPLALCVAMAGTATLLAAGVPTRDVDARARPGCRSGLFDCSLAWPSLAQWRCIGDWPALAASLVMLPMMASLTLLAEGCAQAGWPVQAVTGVHLLAMLAPGWIVAAVPADRFARRLHAVVAAALIAGGLVSLAWPGAEGAMLAMVLQAAAWSMGWSAATALPLRTGPTPLPVAQGGPAASALLGATVVFALGALLAHAGAAATWSAVHLALASLAAIGVVAPAARATRFGLKEHM